MPSLGRKVHTAGNTTRYTIEYDQWLLEGESLSVAAVVLDPALVATITDITISGVVTTPSHEVVFMLAGGSANEVFTLDVQVTNSRGEIKNDTAEFFVAAP